MRIKESETEEELSVNPKDVINENNIKGDTERTISSLKKEIAEILVIQIAHELYNQNLYKTFANYEKIIFNYRNVAFVRCFFYNGTDRKLQSNSNAIKH